MYAEAGGRGRGDGGGQTRFCFFGHAAPSGRAHWLGRGELPSPETLMENKTSNNNVWYTFSCTCNRYVRSVQKWYLGILNIFTQKNEKWKYSCTVELSHIPLFVILHLFLIRTLAGVQKIQNIFLAWREWSEWDIRRKSGKKWRWIERARKLQGIASICRPTNQDRLPGFFLLELRMLSISKTSHLRESNFSFFENLPKIVVTKK